jgi:phosphotransferase system enzyme I (PtsP)
LKVGVMMEVPALAWQLPALFERVDFISVGSNDLTQFMFAVDRGNPRIADRYDVLSPAMLSFLRSISDACRNAGVTLSVCGEMAGRPLEAMALLGVGFRVLSMSAPQVGPVKAMIRSVSLPPLERYMAGLYTLASHSVREELRHFALDHGVQI